jgi:hypothetical protein
MLMAIIQGLAMLMALWSAPAITAATFSGEERARVFLIRFGTVSSLIVVGCTLVDVVMR